MLTPNDEHFRILSKGVQTWNHWRHEHPEITPNLRGAFLSAKTMESINLDNADLTGARMTECFLFRSTLIKANLTGALLQHADLSEADLSEARLVGSNLEEANFLKTNLTAADLTGSILTNAHMVRTNLALATLSGSYVYGTSVWDVNLAQADQRDLVITPWPHPKVTTDNLEVAQFLYLLLNNQKIRQVIETITSKLVLILGRFSPERKAILDAIRGELRKKDYLPVLFDFEKPSNRDITETVSTLAHMARFVIADITDAKSIPQELMLIVPALPSVPVQPLLLESQLEYGMFEHFRRYPWVLEPFLYVDSDQLLASLDSHVVGPAEKKAKEQARR